MNWRRVVHIAGNRNVAFGTAFILGLILGPAAATPLSPYTLPALQNGAGGPKIWQALRKWGALATDSLEHLTPHVPAV